MLLSTNSKYRPHKMRVLIVEDRPHARDELKYLLSLHPDIEVVGECEDTASAWPLIQTGNIDSLFLDIDIETEGPRAGLDLALRIDRSYMDNPPRMVFVTGFNVWARSAIEVQPFGFLDKPLNDAELARTLDRIRQDQLRKNVHPKSQRFMIRHRETIGGESEFSLRRVLADEIVYIKTEAMRNEVNIKLANGDLLKGVRGPLRHWAEELKLLPEFMQIYRSHLVNLVWVSGMRRNPFSEEGFNVIFKDCNDVLPIGRDFLAEFQNRLLS